jgi:tRNA nucleotidyltransferase (CCA-adding enzyme)
MNSMATTVETKKLEYNLSPLQSFCHRLRELSQVVALVYPLIYQALRLIPSDQLQQFSTIDIWRRPERLAQVLAACPAGSSPTLEAMHAYPPAIYLQQKAEKLLNASLEDSAQVSGGAVRQALVRQRRLQALHTAA